MLLAAAILFTVAAVLLALLIAWANGMSDAPDKSINYAWCVGLLLIAGAFWYSWGTA